MRGFFFDVLFYAPTACSQRVSSIQNMDHNIGRVDHLVQLVPYPLALALGKYGFSCRRKDFRLRDCFTSGFLVAGSSIEQLCLLETIQVRVVHFDTFSRQIFQRPNPHFHPFPLRLRAKGIAKRSRLDRNLGLMLFQPIHALAVPHQIHGQFVGFQQNLIRV